MSEVYIRKGWLFMIQRKRQQALERFHMAHQKYQERPIRHAATHISLAAAYIDQPIKSITQIFLGICAPYATQRDNRRKNHTKKRRKKK